MSEGVIYFQKYDEPITVNRYGREIQISGQYLSKDKSVKHVQLTGTLADFKEESKMQVMCNIIFQDGERFDSKTYDKVEDAINEAEQFLINKS